MRDARKTGDWFDNLEVPSLDDLRRYSIPIPRCNCCNRPVLDDDNDGDALLLCVVCDLNGCGEMGESPRCHDTNDPVVKRVSP